MANNFQTFSLGGFLIGATQFTLASDANEQPQDDVVRLMGMGEVQPNASFVATVDPEYTISLYEIEKLLAVLADDNAYAEDLASGSVLYYTKNARTKRATGATHHSVTVNDGVAVLNRLSWSGNNQPWKADVRVIANYNGTNAPFVISQTATMPTFVAPQEVFLGGKLLINGSELVSIQSMSIDFNWQADQIRGGGTVYPTVIEAYHKSPVITGQIMTLAEKATIGIDGLRVTSSVIYLRKVDLATTTTRIADASLEHLSLTIDSGLITYNSVSAPDASGRVTIDFTMVVEKIDTGTESIVYAADVAIP